MHGFTNVSTQVNQFTPQTLYSEFQLKVIGEGKQIW